MQKIELWERVVLNDELWEVEKIRRTVSNDLRTGQAVELDVLARYIHVFSLLSFSIFSKKMIDVYDDIDAGRIL